MVSGFRCASVTGALALLCACVAFGDQTALVTGVVVDAQTGVPVAGATAKLRYRGTNGDVQTTETGTAGEFQFSVEQSGEYVVDASADGYSPSHYVASQPFMKIEDSELADGAAVVPHTTKVQLVRAAGLTGSIRDAVDDHPIQTMYVAAWRVEWYRGKRFYNETLTGFSDEEGNFTLGPLDAGDYVLQIGTFLPQISSGRDPDYGPDRKRRSGYPTIFEPGDPSVVAPFRISAGVSLNTGAIRLAKIDLGRIRGKLSTDPDGGNTNVTVTRLLGGSEVSAVSGQMQEEFTMDGLSPADYRFTLQFTNASQFGFGTETVHIDPGGDPDVTFTLKPDIRFHGSFECECKEGWRDLLEGSRVSIEPIGGGVGSSSIVGPDLSFGGGENFTGMARLEISAEGFVVQRLLYNGASVGTTFTPNPFLADQALRVVLSDKPAAVSGAVAKDGVASAGAHVAIAPWPLSLPDGFPEYRNAVADSEGKFTIAKLSPGTYHSIAVGDVAWQDSQMPDVLAGWLAKGVEFTVAEGQTRALSLEPLAP